jgi:flagellar basal body rod protein FlgG
MPEPIEQPNSGDVATELLKLQKVHTELLGKRQRDKARIAELETTLSETQGRVTAAEARAYELEVGQPLKSLAKAMSDVPDYFLQTLQAHFQIQAKDGALTILTKDGKPVIDAEGKAVGCEPSALGKYLTETDADSERTKVFRKITTVSKASGAASGSGNRQAAVSGSINLANNFGLR